MVSSCCNKCLLWFMGTVCKEHLATGRGEAIQTNWFVAVGDNGMLVLLAEVK